MSLLFLALAQSSSITPAPESRWTVKALAEACSVTRTFTDASEAPTLTLEPLVNGHQGEIILVLPTNRWALAGREGKGTISNLNGMKADFKWDGQSIAKGRYRVSIRVERSFWQWLSDSDQLSIKPDNGQEVLLRFGGDNPLSHVRPCINEIYRGWGADPANVVQLSPVQTSAWFPANSYPIAARSNRQEGRVAMLISFDRQGNPVKCKIVGSSKAEPLDRGTCLLIMSGARLGVTGQQMPDMRHVYAAINWKLR